jgi:hypothetical protein
MKTLVKALPLALIAVLGASTIAYADESNPPIASQVVFFDNNVKWTNVYVHCWLKANNTDTPYTTWPGEKATKLYGNVYYYNIPTKNEYTDLIFDNGNSGSGNQSIDTKISKKYIYSKESVVSTEGNKDYGKYILTATPYTSENSGRAYFTSSPSSVSLIVLPQSTDDLTDDYSYYQSVSTSDIHQVSASLYYVDCPTGTVAIKCNGATEYVAFTASHIYDCNGDQGEYAANSLPAGAIYFDNTSIGWSSVYAYCWNSDNDMNATWPGVKITKLDGNIWYYIPNKNYTNVIFSKGTSGDGNQSGQLDLKFGDIYTYDGKTAGSSTTYTGSLSSASTIYFQNTNNWENVYIYYCTLGTYNSGESSTTPHEMTNLGDGIYSFNFDKVGTYKIMFSDGSATTNVFDYTAAKVYTADGVGINMTFDAVSDSDATEENNSTNKKTKGLGLVMSDDQFNWSANNVGYFSKYSSDTENMNHTFATGYGYWFSGNITGGFFITPYADWTNNDWSKYNGVIIAPEGNGVLYSTGTFNSDTYDSANNKTGSTTLKMWEYSFTFKNFNYSSQSNAHAKTTATADVTGNYFNLDDLKTDATYYIALDFESQTIRIVEVPNDVSTGVEAVDMEDDTDAPVEYFSLQGVKVTNPQNGIYIKKQGNNVSKVVIR